MVPVGSHFLIFSSVAFDQRERAVGTGLVEMAAPDGVLLGAFSNQLISLPDKLGFLTVDRFTGSAIERVVGGGSDPAIRRGMLYQPVATVVFKGGEKFMFFPPTLRYHPTGFPSTSDNLLS